MADKKTPNKRLVVPALNRGIKSTPKKSSVRELGSKANEQYKAGANKDTSPTFGPKKGQKVSARDFGRYRLTENNNDPAKYDSTYTGPGEKPKKGSKSYYEARRTLAQQTGMAKGGLVVKKKGK